MIYSIRVADVPKFVIGMIIAVALLGGLIELWKVTGGMPDWLVYSMLFGIIVVSFTLAHCIWKRIRSAGARR